MNSQDRAMMNDAFNELVPAILEMNQEDPFLENSEINSTVKDLMSGITHLSSLNVYDLETLLKDITEECAFKIGGYKMMNTLPTQTLNNLNIKTL